MGRCEDLRAHLGQLNYNALRIVVPMDSRILGVPIPFSTHLGTDRSTMVPSVRFPTLWPICFANESTIQHTSSDLQGRRREQYTALATIKQEPIPSLKAKETPHDHRDCRQHEAFQECPSTGLLDIPMQPTILYAPPSQTNWQPASIPGKVGGYNRRNRLEHLYVIRASYNTRMLLSFVLMRRYIEW
jgi:hypothetical protein